MKGVKNNECSKKNNKEEVNEKKAISEWRRDMKKYRYSFKEINYGGIEIDADKPLGRGDVIAEIEKGNAFFSDTEYEDIKLESEG